MFLVLVAALAVAVSTFWGLRFVSGLTLASTRAAGQQLPQIYVVGGLRIPLDKGLTRVDSNTSPRPAGRQLLLFGSDDCRATTEILDNWVALIRSVPFQRDDNIIVISVGDRTANTLRAVIQERGIAATVFSVTDVITWTQSSGITGTPSTLLLDEQNRVRLMATPAFVRDRQDVIRRYFDRQM